ncbi:secretin N-terminal domain-containing protein [Methylocaldum sp.]|uniref:secretin N-terminal domain-containing protein n=1 Tax=Methylocaldum sp. TaxID=1969727 RepID=UPI002D3E3C31|nr:secretin N-terminal domain-containing protein [Methylocaldum sp.]HYE36354.1 secretin N-terminal domain-containing protein [Methylocaldum sp.]
MWLRIAFVVIAISAWNAPAAGKDLSTIELFHRPPEEMVPLIQPLLGPNDVVIPARNQLILKADPDKVEEIRNLIQQLDKSSHRLLITVTQGRDLSAETLNAQARLRGRIDLNRPADSDVRIRGHIYQSEGRDSAGHTQQLQTLEGQSAFIQVGEQIPVPTQSYYGYGYSYSENIEYRPATTGFAVTPRLSGSEVIIELSPWSDRLSRDQFGVIDTQSAHTVVRAALGEWIEIGGVVETSVREESGLASRNYSTRSQQNRIFIKVEDLDASKP